MLNQEDAAGQPFVSIGSADRQWVGMTMTISGINGTDTHTVQSVGIGSVTLATNLVHLQPAGSPFTVNGVTANSAVANEATCYLGPKDVINPQANPGDTIFVVSPGDGQFDGGLWEGGGTAQATINGSFSVTIYAAVTTLTDEIAHVGSQLTDATSGLVVAWRTVLAALCNWDPPNGSGDGQTRNPISPRDFQFEEGSGERMSRIVQHFNLEWDQAIP